MRISTGFAFDVEFLALARRADVRMVEFPVDWTHRDGSTLTVHRETIRIAREIVALRRNLRRMKGATL